MLPKINCQGLIWETPTPFLVYFGRKCYLIAVDDGEALVTPLNYFLISTFCLLINASLLSCRYNLGYPNLLLADGHVFIQLGELMDCQIDVMELTIEQHATLIEALRCPVPNYIWVREEIAMMLAELVPIILLMDHWWLFFP